jgi:hypothetical protein
LQPQNNGSFKWVKKPSIFESLKTKFTKKNQSTTVPSIEMSKPIRIANMVPGQQNLIHSNNGVFEYYNSLPKDESLGTSPSELLKETS